MELDYGKNLCNKSRFRSIQIDSYKSEFVMLHINFIVKVVCEFRPGK